MILKTRFSLKAAIVAATILTTFSTAFRVIEQNDTRVVFSISSKSQLSNQLPNHTVD